MSRDVQKVLALLLIVLLAGALVIVWFVWPVQVAAQPGYARVSAASGPWSVIGRGWSSPICPLVSQPGHHSCSLPVAPTVFHP